MKRVFVLLVCYFTMAVYAYGQNIDSVFLYNGQVLVGNIKYADVGILTIDDTDLKLISVKLYKIKKIVATSKIFKIETSNKEVQFGSINSSPKNGFIILQGTHDSIEIKLTDIAYLLKIDKGFLRGITGNVSAGFSFSKSSSLGQLTFSTSIDYVQKRFQYQFNASELASIDSSKFSRDHETAQLFSTYSFGDIWFVSALLSYQRNLELSLARRYQEMPGAGGKLVVTRDLQLLLISGLTFNQEKSTEGKESGLLLEVPVMVRFNFYKFRHPDLQISSIQTVYFGVTETGRVRYDTNNSFSLSIIRDLSVNFSFYTNYDNKPTSSNSNFDYGTSFTLSYKF